jgi:hypothetical protein
LLQRIPSCTLDHAGVEKENGRLPPLASKKILITRGKLPGCSCRKSTEKGRIF